MPLSNKSISILVVAAALIALPWWSGDLYKLHLAAMLSERALFGEAMQVLADAPDDARVWRARACALAASGHPGEALEAA